MGTSIITRTATAVDVAVRVDTSSSALARSDGQPAALAIAQGVVLVGWVVACCVCRVSGMIFGAFMFAAGTFCTAVGPALQSAGAATIKASKGGCDCDDDD